ncbi:MAG TPA: tetratricopeptide repeat protein [Burkholderiales bacterium]|jgi:tetratricopeptide (TPR) repeat protein|nr:tetratricopeptide repeat protein [Burkholderiales bacterium]
MQRFRWIALQGSSRGFLPPLLLFYFITTSGIPAFAADVSAACSSPVARVVSIQGSIEVLPAHQKDWSKVTRLDTPLCEGDRLRTGALSRAALFIQAETLVRVDQNTSISVSQTAEETLVEFTQEEVLPAAAGAYSCGAGYFITRFPRKFKVNTPHLNAAVEGTEFQVAMRCESTELSVFEGKVLAEGAAANVFPAQSISSGQVLTIGGSEPPAIKLLVKPADAVQWVLYYPPLSDATAEADLPPTEQCRSLPTPLNQTCLTQRAEVLLRLGRVEEAQRDVDEAVALDPVLGDGNALRAIINIARNDKASAIEAGTAATTASPNSFRAWLALSYAQQASFELEKSLESARKAQALEPNSSVTNARVAELLMSLGRIKEAEVAARAAVDANPSESRAHTVLGFVRLAQLKTSDARTDFLNAIERDSSDPLPRLGLGLAIIRDGNLADGREQLEIAVALDPTNSLLRSYVGKAYYEENSKERDQLAATQFELAKQLDPNDPTPWLYDAILEQSQNRPVEALEELQRSIVLNDNRAIYRSRLLLDEDRGARGASLARIYQDLGFDQLAVVEAAKSLAVDPGNYSAHLFLADAYVQYPRTQIARESEYLQSQLREPLSFIPLPPLRSESNPLSTSLPSGVARAMGVTGTTLNDFSSLFDRQGMLFSFDGIVAEEGTNAQQFVVSALGDRLAVQLGGGRFETNGFSENRDFTQDAYDVLVRAHLSTTLSVQAEQRWSQIERGGAFFAYDPGMVSPFRLREIGQTTRLGLRYRVDEKSDFVLSVIRQTYDFNFDNGAELTSAADIGEVQHMRSGASWTVVAGVGFLDGNRAGVDGDPLPGSYYKNGYLYGYLRDASSRLQLQLGASFDSYSQEDVGDYGIVCPKLGVIWTPAASTTIRTAVFRNAKPAFIVGHTIEPTQVAGFNQFFDDADGAISWRYGVGLDQQLPLGIRVGGEYSERYIETPALLNYYNWLERQGRLYFYWPIKRLFGPDSIFKLSGALTAEYQQELLQRPEDNTGFEGIVSLRTQYVPIGFAVFPGGGTSLQIRATYVIQQGQLQQGVGTTLFPVEGHFWVTDIAFAYRFGSVRGVQLSVGVSNLFDRQLPYVDPAAASPRLTRERVGFARLALQF